MSILPAGAINIEGQAGMGQRAAGGGAGRWNVPRASSLLLRAFVGAVVLSPLAATSDDAGEWVEVTGEAAIAGDDEARAREQAREQALRRAVEQVAGTIVTAYSETRDFVSVRDEISAQAAGFVERHEVTGAECARGVCRVTVRALVARRTLENRLTELGLLVQRRGYPRVILMIAEQNADAERASTWWGRTETRSQIFENELVDRLNKALADEARCRERLPADEACWRPVPAGHAFRFVDHASLSVSPEVRAEAGVDLTDAQARHLASLTDAEVALVGTASARKLSDLPTAGTVRMISIGGSASVRVIDVRSGQVLTTVNVEPPAVTHISPTQGGEAVLRQAARMAAVELQRRIADAWGEEDAGGRWVRLEVEGLGSYGDLQALRAHLEHGVTGVRAVRQRHMDGTSALLEVLATVDPERLAEELTARPAGNLSIRVVRVDASVLAIDLSR